MFTARALSKTLKFDFNYVLILAPKGYNVSTVQDEDLSSRDQWKRRKRLSYQNKLECWETCEVICLCIRSERLLETYTKNTSETTCTKHVAIKNFRLFNSLPLFKLYSPFLYTGFTLKFLKFKAGYSHIPLCYYIRYLIKLLQRRQHTSY